ncbi:MAG: SDR family oxidoreductase [Planctomycetota bacterium]|nr:SDR family oxidoreductase [Planctomycetota bacterium]
MSIAFFTGFPGFLGSALLPKVLERSPDQRAVCLIQSKFIGQARSRLEDIEKSHPHLRGRMELVVGDLAAPDFGLEGVSRIKQEISEIFHLAAVYDLSVPRDVALQVNVIGTRNVLDFAEESPRLSRLQYVSTCYVSGRYAGTFSEEDLEKGQSFNNFYEETKYLAEVEVRSRMCGGLPATIYRPAIVVGDSRTGATQKYDGPYYVIRWLLRQPFVAVLPVVGKPSATRVNLVPRDYVVDAMTCLSGLDTSVGKVYHLADPHPLTVSELIKLMGHATRRKIVRVPLPRVVAKFAIDRMPGVYWLMQIPSPAIDYFVHPTLYACASTLADLEGSGLKVPPLSSYVDRLVDFVRCHPDIGSRPMV